MIYTADGIRFDSMDEVLSREIVLVDTTRKSLETVTDIPCQYCSNGESKLAPNSKKRGFDAPIVKLESRWCPECSPTKWNAHYEDVFITHDMLDDREFHFSYKWWSYFGDGR